MPHSSQSLILNKFVHNSKFQNNYAGFVLCLILPSTLLPRYIVESGVKHYNPPTYIEIKNPLISLKDPFPLLYHLILDL
jgi:hypothetical protein